MGSRTGLIGWMLLLAAPAIAQETPPETRSGSHAETEAAAAADTGRDLAILDTITVLGTRTERALSQVAATVTVMTDEEMERELARDIADLVRYEPGVTVGGTGDRFGLGGFNIRGIGGNRVLTLVDGVRVPEEFSFGPFLSARRDFVDLDSLARAEIARGPISSLYGSDALGGVVAFSTKDPRAWLAPGETWHAGLKAGYSSADDSAVGTLSLAGGNDVLAGMLMVTRRAGHESGNAGAIGGTGPERELPDPQAWDADNVVARLTVNPAAHHELTLTFDRYDNETVTAILSDYGVLTGGVLTDRRDAVDTRTRTRVSLEYAVEGLAIADDFQATLYSQEADSLQITDEVRSSGGESHSRRRESTFDQDIRGAIVQFGKSLDGAGGRHLLTWGMDWYRTDNASVRDGGTFAADGTPVPEFLPLPTRDFPLTEVDQLAFFLQDEIELFGGRLLLSPGVRYDRFDADATADPVYLSGNPGSPVPADYDDSEVTAKIGAVYAFNDIASVYARYSEGFRAPPYDDVNVGFTNFIGGYKTIANPELESERSEGFELGVRLAGDAGGVTAAAYRNDFENFIESFAIAPELAPFGGIDPADGLLTFQSVNRAEVEISGVELRGDLYLGSFADALEGLSLRASVAYADGEDKESSTPINSIQPLTGVLGLRFTGLRDRFSTELVLTLVDGKEPRDIDDSVPVPATAGYGVVDLLTHVELTERVRLDFGLFNITDRSYVRWTDATGIGNDAMARFTQPGFNAAATVRVEL